ncbi:MAG: TetR/AcrR family transcriptional regulator [Proteobacteria bacterium]|nr:TetR/AcrR family transcriptional regulator [Pseudomonadota bacterium]
MENTELHPTKARILETAARLFFEQGFHATGVSTILREAGVNSGSLYHYFPGKDELLVGVLEHYIRIMRPILMEPVEAVVEDPIGRVFKLLERYREGLVAFDFRLGCPIGNLALEVADDHAEARRLINQNFSNWIDAVRDWLAAAGDRLPARVDRRQLASFILTTMEGGIMQSRAARSLDPFDASVAQLRAYFDALQAEAAGSQTTSPSHSCSPSDSAAPTRGR